MKRRIVIIGLMACTLSAHASFYNTLTGKETEADKALPDNIQTAQGFTAHPTDAQLRAAGWLLAEIVPFVPAEGYEIIPKTRSISVVEDVPYEQWQVETHAEAEARRAAEKDAQETATVDFDNWTEREKAFIKLMVKELNKLRALHGLPQYTGDQVKAALKAELAE